MNLLELIPRTKRTAGAARVLLALALADVAKAKARILALPSDAAGQKRQLIAELAEAHAVLQTYIAPLKGLPTNAPWPEAAASLLYIVPNAKIPTPTALWPHRILAGVTALEDHARDMEGELARQLSAAVAELPERAMDAGQAIVSVASNAWVPVLIVGSIAAVGIGAVLLVRSSR
jgi:hypothetical protein